MIPAPGVPVRPRQALECAAGLAASPPAIREYELRRERSGWQQSRAVHRDRHMFSDWLPSSHKLTNSTILVPGAYRVFHCVPVVLGVNCRRGAGKLVDIVTPERRSEIMARIRGRDTVPEVVVRRTAHRLGFRFRLYRKDLPGRPDLVFPRYKAVVFVHGCFWHRHDGCRFAYTPRSRVQFWTEKFRRNVARDRRTEDALHSLGWRVLVIWECETRDDAVVVKRLEDFLRPADLDGRGTN